MFSSQPKIGWIILDSNKKPEGLPGFHYLSPESVMKERTGGCANEIIMTPNIFPAVGHSVKGVRNISIMTQDSISTINMSFSLSPDTRPYWVMSSSGFPDMLVTPTALEPPLAQRQDNIFPRSDLDILGLFYAMKVANFPVYCVSNDTDISFSLGDLNTKLKLGSREFVLSV